MMKQHKRIFAPFNNFYQTQQYVSKIIARKTVYTFQRIVPISSHASLFFTRDFYSHLCKKKSRFNKNYFSFTSPF